jgi:hypothetical protein
MKVGLDWMKKTRGLVLEISDAEVEDMCREPDGYGYNKVVLKRPKTWYHPSWKRGWGGMNDYDELWYYFSTGHGR